MKLDGISGEFAALLIEYVVTHDTDVAEAMFGMVSGGPGYFDLPIDEANAVANKLQDIIEAAESMQLMPKGPAKSKVRLFHSIIDHPRYPNIFAAIEDILKNGLSVERAREYKSWAGPFRVIWTQTDEPYNKNVVWIAFDLDRKYFSDMLLEDIDDPRRKSPVLVHLNMDVPGKKIVAVNGFPVKIVRKAL